MEVESQDCCAVCCSWLAADLWMTLCVALAVLVVRVMSAHDKGSHAEVEVKVKKILHQNPQMKMQRGSVTLYPESWTIHRGSSSSSTESAKLQRHVSTVAQRDKPKTVSEEVLSCFFLYVFSFS